jgi:hypothetical protein
MITPGRIGWFFKSMKFFGLHHNFFFDKRSVLFFAGSIYDPAGWFFIKVLLRAVAGG